MRYLKNFNESYIVDTDELQEFCEWNLATLLDNGYKVDVEYDEWDDDNDNFYISIESNKFGSFFSWDDLKDYVIPFMMLLKDEDDIDWDGYDIKFMYRRMSNWQSHGEESSASYGDYGYGQSGFFKLQDLEDLHVEKIYSVVIKVKSRI